MKKTLAIASVSIVVLVLFAALRGGEWTEYKGHQEDYHSRLVEMDGGEVDYPIKVRQLVLEKLGKIDRCVSCHVAMEDPRMAGEDTPQPLRKHPGKILETHDIQKVGCTSCHDGQGRAITKVDAHANEFGHWERKRLTGKLVQATCVRCHSADAPEMAEMTTFARGRDLFRAKGCLGCHKLNGKGGHVGPDLSQIGAASTHMKMPADDTRAELLKKFNGDVNLAFIYESIMTPKAQPVESMMFDYDLGEDDASALTVYLKSFATSTVPDDLQRLDDRVHVAGGEELYSTFCSACHGPKGMGTSTKELAKVGPAVANPHFLAVVEPQFIRYKVAKSGDSVMPAWAGGGGLASAEIDRVTEFLVSRKTDPPAMAKIDEYEGKARFGSIYFENKCASCHGLGGEHETDLIGPTLDSPEFASYADRKFVYRAIAHGRVGTAMPAWYFLPPQEYADILAYFEAHRDVTSRFADVQIATKALRAVTFGQSRFEGLCGTCHGVEARGNIGPSLNSPEFQTLASDRLIYDVVTAGRKGTAMGGRGDLGSEDIGWIIAYIRSTSSSKATRHFEPGEVLGSESRGKVMFARTCAQCHGEVGMGHVGPAIGNADFLAQVDDGFIKETAAYGRSGTGMMGNLRGQGGTVSMDERQVNDVTAYMRSLQAAPRRYAGTARTQGDVSLGRTLFARTCAQCHGPAGSGDKGPGIGRKGFLLNVTDGFLEGTIANGRTRTEMRPFTQGAAGLVELSEHEIRSVVRYLRSGRDVAKIQPKRVHGTAGTGEVLYKSTCSQCHGTQREASFAPHLMNPVFLQAASDSYLQATMSLGRHDSQMRSMMRGGGGLVEMTSKEANDIISYLRLIEKKRK